MRGAPRSNFRCAPLKRYHISAVLGNTHNVHVQETTYQRHGILVLQETTCLQAHKDIQDAFYRVLVY